MILFLTDSSGDHHQVKASLHLQLARLWSLLVPSVLFILLDVTVCLKLSPLFLSSVGCLKMNSQDPTLPTRFVLLWLKAPEWQLSKSNKSCTEDNTSIGAWIIRKMYFVLCKCTQYRKIPPCEGYIIICDIIGLLWFVFSLKSRILPVAGWEGTDLDLFYI